MKRLYTYYQNLKYRKKVMLLCFIVSFIPILILGLFCLAQTRRSLISHEKMYLNNILEQANSSLNSYLNLQENIISTLAWDESIQLASDTDYDNNYDMFLAYRDVFDSKFPMIQSMHDEITQITLYTSSNLYPHSTIIDSTDVIQEAKWYQTALTAKKSFFVYDKKTNSLQLVCPIPCQSKTNIILMTLSYDDTFSKYESLFEDDYAIGIYDNQNNLLFHYSELNDTKNSSLRFYPILKNTIENNNTKTYFKQSTNENDYGWTILIYRPLREINKSANAYIFVILGIILLCVITISFIGPLLSRQVVHPLEQLSSNMDMIQADNLAVTVTSNNQDEISHLFNAFTKMTQRLDNTIDELYRNKIMKQEYRLQMLQSQINPHFLYNCLSMINSKAIRSNQNDISRITLLLSTFYRTCLNKGHNSTTVHDEWRNTISYIEIQKMLHSSSFEVIYSIDENLYPFRIINMLLQPIVENAILHGLDNKKTGSSESGIITICGELDTGCMKFVITDNGCGMSDEVLNSIIVTETKGYGIHNVDQRIKLFFGENYGISIKSELEKGTAVTIVLPLVS